MEGKTAALLISISCASTLIFIGLGVWFAKGFSLIVLVLALGGLFVAVIGNSAIQFLYRIKSLNQSIKQLSESAR